MRLVRDYQRLMDESARYVVTIGNFDGLHLGHQKMLARLEALSQKYQLPRCVIIFEPLPQAFFSPVIFPRLTQLSQKIDYFREFGIELLLCLRFNKSLANISATRFIEMILISALRTKALVIGDDFRFGYQREGNIESLRRAGQQYGFELSQVETVYQQSERVSSTQVRQALVAGDLSLARRLLGRPFSFSSRVVRGRQLGRTLGFPTANLLIQENFPLRGVYLVRVYGLEQVYYAIVNVGRRPTVRGEFLCVEAHLLNFSGDLYRRRIRLSFLYKLRDEISFPEIELLRCQIAKDKQFAEEIITFLDE